MKKTAVVLLSLVLFISMLGCTGGKPAFGNRTDKKGNAITGVYDIDDNFITDIASFGNIHVVSDGLVYKKIVKQGKDGVNYDIYHFSFSSKKHVKLGRIKDATYESSYNSVYHNDHIYTVYCIGDFYKGNSESYLYDFDLTNNSMSFVKIGDNIAPITSMAVRGDEVFIMALFESESAVYKYDIKTKKIKEEIREKLDENTVGDSIRAVYADEKFLYVLKVRLIAENDKKMIIDRYDVSMNLCDPVDITDAFLNNKFLEEDPYNEMAQVVNQFKIKYKCLYYENKSITRYMLDLREDDLSDLIRDVLPVPQSSSLYMAQGISDEETDIFYEAVNNNLYFFDYQYRAFRKYEFMLSEEGYYIGCVMRCNDNCLLYMTGNNKEGSEDSPTPKYYYVSVEDIKNRQK